MTVTIQPGTARGRLTAPPSKSVTHRALIAGALSAGRTTVSGVDFSADIEATRRCLSALGAAVAVSGDTVTLGEWNPAAVSGHPVLDCGESGSTLRFLLPLCLLSGTPVTLTGSARLMERPLGVYEVLCREHHCRCDRDGTRLTVCGRLTPGVFTLPGDVSSQFVSGLLFALPLLNGDSDLHLTGTTESESYIRLTLRSLSASGVRTEGELPRLHIPGGQPYRARSLTVEGDWSNAAFFEALNLFGGEVTIEGLDENSVQGDRVCRTAFAALRDGCPTLDLTDCPDLAPVLFAAAAALQGATFTGTRRLRLKESDRASAMRQELEKFGALVTVGENTVTVTAAPLHTPDAILDGHNDHRIVMALTVLCSLTGGRIAGAQAVTKSMPGFFGAISALGLQIKEQEDETGKES